ncbi:MAG: recombinase family protein [Gaiellaceae bacterium MAG52_C11]|nr:recombinase family protein [Candidatus Gaiellasilicea maunaloa]
MTRVCLYTRISTDEENQPTSLHSQRERLQAFCTAQEEWRVVSHQEDRATGTKLDRPGLQAALELARNGVVDMLLVYRVDRLSRKVRQLAQLAEELDTYSVTLRSATEPFDTGSAAGRMMLQMLAVFAEFEHATIVDRVTAGIERRAKEGRWYAGRPPYGYSFSDSERRLVPDPVKAPVVRRIFQLYTRDRLGTMAIANQLSHEQAPAPAAGWGHPGVHGIVSNPTYSGKIRWRDQLFNGIHEPLIDELTFTRAQTILRERGEDSSLRRGNASDYLLSGVIRCGHCGKAYVGMSARGNGGRYEYYACTNRQKHGPKACRNDRLPRKQLERAVLAQLARVYRDGDLVTDALAKAARDAEQARPELEQRVASIAAEIARAEQALERYYEAFEQGTLSPQRCNQTAHATPSAPRRPPRPTRRTLPHNATRGRTRAHGGRSRCGRRPTRTGCGRGRAAEDQGASPTPDRRNPRRRPSTDPADLQARCARGLRNVRKSGRYWARTSDPQLVELVSELAMSSSIRVDSPESSGTRRLRTGPERSLPTRDPDRLGHQWATGAHSVS